MKLIKDIQVFVAVQINKKETKYVEQFVSAAPQDIRLFHCPSGTKIETIADDTTGEVTAKLLGDSVMMEYLITIAHFNPFAITKEEYDRVMKAIENV